MNIALIHVTTGERVSVDADLSTKRGFLVFRWGMSGLYTLNLKDNVIQAVSTSVRLRHRLFTPWIAADIHAVRKMVAEAQKDASKEAEQARTFAEHEASMPYRSGPDVIVARGSGGPSSVTITGVAATKVTVK